MTRNILTYLATIALCCIAILQCRAAWADGFDVLRIDMPDKGYATAFAGCMTYPEPDNLLVFYCAQQFRLPLQPVTPSSNSFILAAFAPQFEMFGTPCRMVDTVVHTGYTVYDVLCYDDELFAGGFEADGLIHWEGN